jgi:hypothetical protein
MQLIYAILILLVVFIQLAINHYMLKRLMRLEDLVFAALDRILLKKINNIENNTKSFN